ncbi:MAG: carbamoyl-phosphate synthase large subunit, partial [Phycisphaerae bacterium]
RYAIKMGWTVDQVYELTRIDPWFLENIRDLVRFEQDLLDLAQCGPEQVRRAFESAAEGLPLAGRSESIRRRLKDLVARAKSWGYSDVQLATVFGVHHSGVRAARKQWGIEPVYKLVDTCAAEFEAYTPYYYSSYESPANVAVSSGIPSVAPSLRRSVASDDEIRVSDKPKVIILGGGPNRIGQGIEFDYCCVHAVFAARDMGYETVMVNSNPETVSTDYDTSDLLFFEPLTHEDVLNICERLNGRPLNAEPGARNPNVGLLRGIIVQFGGQTPLNLAQGLKNAGVPILGTSPECIHLAEDREAFAKVLNELGLRQPENGIAYDLQDAREIAKKIGYPVLVRPSYVLGGRAMQKCHLEQDLVRYMEEALQATDRTATVGREHPILIDRFLSEATEVDVDCICDGRRAVICGVMEHIEEAGIHSGDSACALPPYSLSPAIVDEIRQQTERLAKRLGVVGLMNVQYAVKDDVVYVLEVNPRASRTVPFVSKATGVPWAKLATQVMLGRTLEEALAARGLTDAPWPRHISVKESVFPFNKFPGVDCILGPEMRSTGEVMGIDTSFPIAFAKAEMAAGCKLPLSGTVLLSVNDHDKPLIVPIGREFAEMGFRIISTLRTREALLAAGVPAELVKKVQDAEGPYLIDMINNGQVDLLINTPIYWGSAATESRIRSAAVMHNIPLITTITGARAAVRAIRAMRQGEWGVRPLQEYIA